jgi:aspartyl-tRNA(Asn)/glutamyl-tRNA(Gln) amidotransferase subunit B
VSESAYEIVIGLEVHAQLATATKMFCGCVTGFGAAPNTQTCPICQGMPGSLPVINRRAIEFGVKTSLALGCTVNVRNRFARKHYYYPDMPKNYQISQYEEPLAEHGLLAIGSGDGTRDIRVQRLHLEEDVGKLIHEGALETAAASHVDYNRAGVPLMEIVSEPDLRSAEQAKAYVAELRATLGAIGVSDVKMEEGSLRIDANVSVRPAGSPTFGTRTEIKNVNSLRSLGRAIEYEVERQIEVLESGGSVVQETRHWNEDDGRTHSMRTKEEAYDYRYFPEPDLVPIAPTAEMRAHVRASLPELPAARRARLQADWGLSARDADLLVADPALADYTVAAVAALPSESKATPKDVVNWATGDLQAHLNETGGSASALAFGPDALAELVALVASGDINRKQGKDVLGTALRDGGRPKDIVAAQGLAQVSDEGAIAAVVDEVLAANATVVDEWRAGDDKVRKAKRGFLMGAVMKALKGQGNPAVANRLLDERLGAS